MQQPPQQMMTGGMPSFPPQPTNITTEQIQKCLDENKKLILAILENQNLGKLAECAQYQTQLQKNLMYLAAIADAQPQAPVMPGQQMAQHPGMQQTGYYMQQHPQAAAAMAQQQGLFPQKMQMQFNSPQQMHEAQQQLHQAMQGQMGMRPGGANGLPSMHHNDNTHGGSKQDNSEAVTGGDGGGSSGAGHGSGDGEDK